jgi:hypothetical protein
MLDAADGRLISAATWASAGTLYSFAEREPTLALTGAPGLDEIYGYTFLHPDRTGPRAVRLPAARASV